MIGIFQLVKKVSQLQIKLQFQKEFKIGIYFQTILLHFINNNFYSMIQESTDVKMCGQTNNHNHKNFRQDQEEIKLAKNQFNSAANQTQISKKFSRMKVIYMGTSVIETVNISSIIFLQSLSEKMEIKTSICLTITSLVLLGIFLVFFWNASIQQIHSELTNLEQPLQKQKNNELFSLNEPVLSKIAQKSDKNNVEKVKVQTINVHQVTNNLSTVQRLKNAEQPASSVAKDSIMQNKLKKNYNFLRWFISKIVQCLFIFIWTTISLTVIQDPKSDGINIAVILIIVSYLLIFFMLLGLFKLKQMSQGSRYQRANYCNTIKIEAKIIQLTIKPKRQIKAIVSFQQKSKNQYCQTECLVQKGKKKTVHNFINPTCKPKFNKSQNYITQIENVPKMVFKKSALKTQKNNLKQIQIVNQPTLELQVPETKRVEITSKQVQYFQYSQYQPSNSAIDNKINRKQDINKSLSILANQKSMQKYKQQMQLVQKKKKSNKVMTDLHLKAKVGKQQIVKSEKIINQLPTCA